MKQHVRSVVPEAAEVHDTDDVFVINRETIQFVRPVCFLAAERTVQNSSLKVKVSR